MQQQQEHYKGKTLAIGGVSSHPLVHRWQLRAAAQTCPAIELGHGLVSFFALSWEKETHPQIIQFSRPCEGLVKFILNDPALATHLDGGKFS